MPRLDQGLVSIDANVAADFHVVGRLDLLRGLFAGRLLASDFVVAELARAQIVLDCAEIVGLPIEALDSFQLLREQHRDLGVGELGAICVAQQRGAIVLSNDKQARKLAAELGLEISGSLSILRHGAEINALTAAQAIETLDRMLALGSWFGADLVEEFKRSLQLR